MPRSDIYKLLICSVPAMLVLLVIVHFLAGI